MKKGLVFFCLVLFAIIGFSQGTKTVYVSILAEQDSEAVAPLLEQLKNEVKAVVGQSATVIFNPVLHNNYDSNIAKENYQKILGNSTDIIIAFGVLNTMMLYNEKSYPKPTIVFGAINSSFIDLPKDKNTSGIDNLTYLYAPNSYAEDLEDFQALFQYKNIGIIIDDHTINALPIKSFFDNYFKDKASTYELIPLHSKGNFENDLTNIDAVYLAGGIHLNGDEFKAMVNKINVKKIPSFSGFRRDDVVRGVLAGNKPESNMDQFFRRIALDVESIVAGENAADLPLHIDYKNTLTINMTTAKDIGFPLKYTVMASSELIGQPSDKKTENTYSIIDIMKTVVGENLALSAAKKNIELANQDVKNAKNNYLPSLDASANGLYIDPKLAEISNGQNPEFSTGGRLNLEQLIYSPTASGGISVRKELIKAEKEAYNAAELDALLNATVAYFNALILKKNANIQNQNVQVTKKNLSLAEQNFEEGASGRSDVLRFKSQLSQNTQSLIEAKNTLKQAYFSINQLMNNPISTEIGVEDAALSVGVFKNDNYYSIIELLDDPTKQAKLIQFFIEEAKNNAPELKDIGYTIAATQKNYKLNSNSRFIPTVALQGQYNLMFSKAGKGVDVPVGFPEIPDGSYNAGIYLSSPIFQRNQRNINRQTAKIQEDQLTIQQENIALSIDKNIHDIVLDLVNQISNIEISKIAEATAKESLDLTQNAYEEGAVPIIQLIDAQSNYLQAQLASATANYTYLIVSMQLERAISYFFLMHTEAENQEFIQRATQYLTIQK